MSLSSMFYCWSSELRANLLQMILGGREKMEELQVVPIAAVCLDCFVEKLILFSDLAKCLIF